MAAVFHAYNAMSTCRTMNGDIPWTAVDAYARRYGVEDFDFLVDCIYGFDRAAKARTKAIAAAGETPGKGNANA